MVMVSYLLRIGMNSALIIEMLLTFIFLFIILGSTSKKGSFLGLAPNPPIGVLGLKL